MQVGIPFRLLATHVQPTPRLSARDDLTVLDAFALQHIGRFARVRMLRSIVLWHGLGRRLRCLGLELSANDAHDTYSQNVSAPGLKCPVRARLPSQCEHTACLRSDCRPRPPGCHSGIAKSRAIADEFDELRIVLRVLE
ncbi:hypothetical protein AURDEDRAFT_117621 [Auricularia subglabra TFB-10046 SS5]|nr:hypothetical protein AURDEDRAFT_117621 [Auricularia subglabra TFB-10046 SS5]